MLLVARTPAAAAAGLAPTWRPSAGPPAAVHTWAAGLQCNRAARSRAPAPPSAAGRGAPQCAPPAAAPAARPSRPPDLSVTKRTRPPPTLRHSGAPSHRTLYHRWRPSPARPTRWGQPAGVGRGAGRSVGPGYQGQGRPSAPQAQADGVSAIYAPPASPPAAPRRRPWGVFFWGAGRRCVPATFGGLFTPWRPELAAPPDHVSHALCGNLHVPPQAGAAPPPDCCGTLPPARRPPSPCPSAPAPPW